MIVLDAYAVIALLGDEPAADMVQQLLETNDEAALTVLGVAEVINYLVRRAGTEEDDAVLDLGQVGLSTPQPLDVDLAMRAGLLRARHYHRRTCAVSLADCVAIETARALAVPVASSDPHLLDVCAAEGVAFLALPDSTGATWTR
jgi:PIN domain nuclease of toxin-antitoxin system